MMRVLILGAGGHAHVAADIFLQAREHGSSVDPIGYLDDNPALHGSLVLDLPVLGPLEALTRIEHDATFVAIGDNVVRARVFAWLLSLDEAVANAIHPRSILASSVSIGRGVLVAGGAVVNPMAIIGDDTIVNTGATIDHHCVVGAHCHVAPGVHMGGNVRVGEGTLVGIGSVVMPGCRIGHWSVVGAGSTVTDDVPDNVTFVGRPGTITKRRSGR